jgi:hypothetical protein
MSTASKRAWFARHRQVNTWVEQKDFDELLQRAEHAGMTISCYVRHLLSIELEREMPIRRS